MSALEVAVLADTATHQDYTPELYANIPEILAGQFEAPQPTIGNRADGERLFYPGAINALVGAPESGKTLIALCVFADVLLYTPHGVLVVDIDHNGAAAIVAKFRYLGVSEATLKDPSRFRYAAPESKEELLAVVQETQLWKPAAVLVDSVGEVLPMFGASSNDADDYTAVFRQVFSPLAKSGAAVIQIDHEPKSDTAAGYGATGTMAKKRAIDGALYRVKVKQPFAPGSGGKAYLSILKDRHGAVRATSQGGVSTREPIAATFHLKAGEAAHWVFYPPTDGDNLAESKLAQDVETLKALTPPPHSVQDVKDRCTWGTERARRALRDYRLTAPVEGSVPVPLLKERGTGTTLTPNLEEYPGTPQEQERGEF
jgi:hypothetical protein